VTNPTPEAPEQGADKTTYRDRQEAFENEAASLQKVSDRIANWRLVAFLLILAPVILGLVVLGESPVSLLSCYGAALIALVAFVLLVIRHAKTDMEVRRLTRHSECNARAIARLERDWNQLPERDPDGFVDQPTSRDLDLFGRASLYQLLATAVSPAGRQRLAMAISEGETRELRDARQGAIRELAGRLDLRQAVECAGLDLVDQPVDQPLPARPPTDALIPKFVTGILAWLLPVLAVGGLGFGLVGWGPIWICYVGLIGIALVNLIYGRQTAALLDPLARLESFFGEHAEQLHRIAEGGDFEDSHLCSIAESAGVAAEALETLDNLTTRAQARGSMPHFVFKHVFLWDIWTAKMVTNWQGQYGDQLDGWLDDLAEFEVVSAFAQFYGDEPSTTFAAMHSERRFEAKVIGHPLLRPADRVSNDVALGPEGTFLLVTGSNMSGKSTLLRSIGLNARLAQAGASVCADHLLLPSRIALATSIKVEDSLDDGLSFFRAELERIKEVVDLAEKNSSDSGHPEPVVVLFLLDEILRGTNSEERRTIVARVVARLCDVGAIGAVTTHDLALADVQELRDRCQLVHFQEHFDGEGDDLQMRFDYQLREGLSPTTNAVKMMKMVGLDL